MRASVTAAACHTGLATAWKSTLWQIVPWPSGVEHDLHRSRHYVSYWGFTARWVTRLQRLGRDKWMESSDGC